jgi:hypothetical protein
VTLPKKCLEIMQRVSYRLLRGRKRDPTRKGKQGERGRHKETFHGPNKVFDYNLSNIPVTKPSPFLVMLYDIYFLYVNEAQRHSQCVKHAVTKVKQLLVRFSDG